MKIEKQDLRENIEQLISEGVINGEEIDVTTEKVFKLVWVLIDYLQTQGKNNGDLEDVVGQSEALEAEQQLEKFNIVNLRGMLIAFFNTITTDEFEMDDTETIVDRFLERY